MMEMNVDIGQVLERVLPPNLEATPRMESPAELELLTRRDFQEATEDAFSWTVPLKNILVARVVIHTDTVVLPVDGVDSLCLVESVALLPYARRGRLFLYTGAVQHLTPANFDDFLAQSCLRDSSPAAMPYAVPQSEPHFECVSRITVLTTADGGC